MAGNDEDVDSLFGSGSESSDTGPGQSPSIATRLTPPIPGLFIFPRAIPLDVEAHLLASISRHDVFLGGSRNQVMLFENPSSAGSGGTFPIFIEEAITIARTSLQPLIPSHIHDILFQPPGTFPSLSNDRTPSRQIILNLYPPPAGISPHIDLPHRYDDGIVGICSGSGCVIELTRGRDEEEQDAEGTIGGDEPGQGYAVYLPAGTIYALTGDARWKWKHGIPERYVDVVEDERADESGEEMVRAGGVAEPQRKVSSIIRDVRVSITMRWMKAEGNVLDEKGGDDWNTRARLNV